MTRIPVSITLTRYREPDWLVDEALDSLAAQEGVTGEVVFLDQNWDADFAEKVEARGNERLTFKCLPCEEKGICYARNLGIKLARHDVVIQIDPDVVVNPDWAETLVRALMQDDAALAGTRILPRWRGRRPLLSKSNVVLDQYSVLDWGDATMDVERIVSAGFALDRRKFRDIDFFDEKFGRRKGVLFGGAESDLSRRVREAGEKVIYVGAAVTMHQILPERMRWSWALRRLYFAGAARRQQGGAPAPSRKPGLWDWLLLPVILPPYALGYFRAYKPAKAS